MKEIERIRWRCRRGLLELDIVLGRFVQHHYAGLTPEERDAFDRLLEVPDNPLWDMIAGSTERGASEVLPDVSREVLEKIRAS